MGIHDREYYHRAPPRIGFGQFTLWSVTNCLIILNVGVFVLDGVLRHSKPISMGKVWETHAGLTHDFFLRLWLGPLTHWGYFSADAAVSQGQAWRFLTFQFLHASPMHLVTNILVLLVFATIVEQHLGARRFLAFYVLCGVAGAASYLLLNLAHVLPDGAMTPMVGASASVFGVLVAAFVIAPDAQVWTYCNFPVTVRTLVIVGLTVAGYGLFSAGCYSYHSAGEAAHLGGGVLGFVLIKNEQWLNVFALRRRVAIAGRIGSGRPRRIGEKDWRGDFDR